MKYKCLSIAGFDGSGGAGLQADLKTFSAFGCYGMTVLTALPVQNTCGIRSCYHIPVHSIQEQMETIFEDIMPDSIKIGMLFSCEIVECVANTLKKYAKDIPIVLDPVMVAKSGDPLLLDEAVEALKSKLIPLASIITPNLPEAYKLVENKVKSMKKLAKELLTFGSDAVLVKGGHLQKHTSDDIYFDKSGAKVWLKSIRIDSKNTHGTGCTLSAAICAGLALGLPMIDACQLAKQYLSQAIKAAQYNSVGKGHGPVHHFYHLWPTLNKIKENLK